MYVYLYNKGVWEYLHHAQATARGGSSTQATMRSFPKILIALSLASLALASGTPKPFSIEFNNPNGDGVVLNSGILAGSTNTSAIPVFASRSGAIANNGGQISWHNINPQVLKVTVDSKSAFTGARFSAATSDLFYGVWEYPWSDQITNNGVEFQLLGVGDEDGVNWSNARAPFFITSAGYGVYADTNKMGSFDFTIPGQAQFVFNTSSLVYYIITPKSKGDYKSIVQAYTAISERIEMPPDSSYGPTFWSDDFEQDFHGSVSNAQENYYDVVNHLYFNQIRATSFFADRKFGQSVHPSSFDAH
jgi:alpha-D-xyloside xylohydrolase